MNLIKMAPLQKTPPVFDEDSCDLFDFSVPAQVFDSGMLGEVVPDGFDAVRISLDATLKADLRWENECKAAEVYIQQGLMIFWEIRLGLFDNLLLPLSNQSQFLSLCLSLEHFRDTVWDKFRKSSVGLCIYRGNADFSRDFSWSEEQIKNLQEWMLQTFVTEAVFLSETHLSITHFSEVTPDLLLKSFEGHQLLSLYCRDVAGEYLELLAHRMPDSLPCYILLDADQSLDPLMAVQLTTKERFPNIHVGIRNVCFSGHALSWDAASGVLGTISQKFEPLKDLDDVLVGVCLPPMSETFPSAWAELREAVTSLSKGKIAFRPIPEIHLTTEWDGLDYLVVSSKTLTNQGFRKLQGFCAAGGIVATLGDCIGLSEEINFKDLPASL